jgi:hypothetical protein
MKQITVLLLFGLLLGCKPNPREMIVKKWKPVDASGINADARKTMLEKGHGMQFFADGKFITFSPELNDTGSYTLSADGRTLDLYTFSNMQTSFQVKELKFNRLVIVHQDMELVLKPEE